MRSNERNILIGLVGVVVIAAFYFLILGPKRNEASDASAKVSAMKAEVAQQQQAADQARQAKAQFATNYQHVVALGEATPDNGDTASMLVQIQALASKSSVDFQSIELDSTGAPAASATPAQPGLSAAPPASSQPSATSATGGSDATTAPAAQTAPATEASASSLPIGAAVGPAGLSVLKYKLHFIGDFFQIAHFVQGVDGLVKSPGNKIVVNGRLSTIDGFSLQADQGTGFPTLDAALSITTYVTPPGQGLTGGASPSAPSSSTGTPQLASSGTGSTP